MVPDHGSRVEPQPPALLLQPPADIHVVAGHAELGIEPANGLEEAFRNAMLQPGMCSASRSESRTWMGPPGALATHSAIGPSPGGGMLGPPTAAYVVRRKVAARYVSQCGTGRASSSR
jgi:hypothetical protein